MIRIKIGYECGDALHCNMRNKCKYRAKWYKLHNLQVSIHRFFEYHLHIKLPYLIHVRQEWKRLSGTKKCPFGKSRCYTCYDCKFSSGCIDGECLCKERRETPYKEHIIRETEWGKQCGYFEKSKWADDYNN